MPELDPRDLVTINLKYGSAATPRKTLAFSQLCAKVLYPVDRPLDAGKLRNKIATTLGVHKISEQPVVEGLMLLEGLGKVTRHAHKWQLTDNAREEIENDIARSKSELDGLLRRHFPSAIDRTLLVSWFNEAAARVFGQFGDEWVAAVCRGTRQSVSRLKPLRTLLGPSTRKYKLEEHAGALEAGFLEFLRSEEIPDQGVLMSLGQAMFSARLVAADIGADPITLEEFRAATILLDTNLLFAIALEDHRLAKSVRALGRAFNSIGAKAIYVRPTKEEFDRAVSWIRRQLLPLVETFPNELIAGVHNDFVATARSRGCRTREDYERFFTELSLLPTELSLDTPLSMMEDPEIARAITRGEEDTRLKQRIKALAAQIRPEWRRREKPDASLQHDAALMHVTEGERTRGAKFWVLSLDRSLQACAVERAGPHSMPAVVSVDALVEILAADGAGPSVDPTDFAPLIARIIVNECAPPAGTYTVEDLQWMYSINEGVAELSADDAKDIARVVAKARVEGARVGDAQLALKVNRLFQVKRREAEERLQDALERARGAEVDVGREREEKAALQRELVRHRTRDIVRTARRRLALRLAWRIPVALAGATSLWWLVVWLARSMEHRDVVASGLSLLGCAAALWKLGSRPISEYRAEVKVAQERAQREVLARARSNGPL